MHTSTKMRRAASRVLEPLTAAARISTNGAARRKQSDDRDVASKRKASRATHTRRLPPTAQHRKRSPGVKVGATRPGSPQGRRPRRTGSPRLDRRSGWPKAPSPRRPLPEKTGASREVEHPGASKGCLHPLPGRSLLRGERRPKMDGAKVEGAGVGSLESSPTKNQSRCRPLSILIAAFETGAPSMPPSFRPLVAQ